MKKQLKSENLTIELPNLRSQIGFGPKNTIPNNEVAKRVVYDDCDRYNPMVKSRAHLYSTSPLPMRNLENIPHKLKNDPNFKDWTGYKVGYFTVVGLLFCDQFDKWVLRCCCGNYECRRAKTLKKIGDQVDQNRCQACIDTERLRNKHGLYPWQQKKGGDFHP